MDEESREVRVDGVVVDLTRTEFDLLAALASRPGRVLQRETLLREVWQTDWEGNLRLVEAHMSNLRRKLVAAGLNSPGDPDRARSGLPARRRLTTAPGASQRAPRARSGPGRGVRLIAPPERARSASSRAHSSTSATSRPCETVPRRASRAIELLRNATSACPSRSAGHGECRPRPLRRRRRPRPGR